MGIPLTLPHRYDFGDDTKVVGDDLLQAEAWDALRTQTTGAFAMARDRAELERQADERPEIGERMREVDALLTEGGARKVVSYGVGGGLPELWLLRINPGRELVVTDFAPETVNRLRGILPEAEVHKHDLLNEAPLEGDMHVFHRIDTELDNEQWRGVYRRFAAEPVLVVAGEFLPVRDIPKHLRIACYNRKATNAGWMRTQGAFNSLWRKTHRASHRRLSDLDGWLLEPKGS